MIDISLLAKESIFASLASHELEHLAKLWTRVTKDEKHVIFEEGDVAQSIYIIEKGSVSITIPALSNDEVTLALLHDGDVFGELTLFDMVPRTATARALERTTLLEIPRDKFINFLKANPEVAIAILGVLSKRLRDTDALMERRMTRNVNKEIQKHLSFGDKLSDKFSDFIGSWRFILIFLLIVVGWITFNVFIFFFKPLDPYPFQLLNVILSCLAAFQAPIIMMSQNRQAKTDRFAAELDYKINLKSELQIEEILMRLDEKR